MMTINRHRVCFISFFALSLLLLSSRSVSAASWTSSGSNIYYNAGNVGIGTSNPTVGVLQNVGDSFFYSSNGAYSEGINVFYTGALSTGGGLNFHFGAANTTPSATTLKGDIRIRGTNQNMIFSRFYSGNDYVFLENNNINGDTTIANTSGKVAIGTSTASSIYELSVNGSEQVKGDLRVTGNLILNGLTLASGGSSGGTASSTSSYSTSTCPTFSGNWDIDKITTCTRNGRNLTMTTYYVPFFDLFFIISGLALSFLILFRRKKNAD